MTKLLILFFCLFSSAFSQFPNLFGGAPSFPSISSLPKAPFLPSAPSFPNVPPVEILQSGLESVVTPFNEIQNHLNNLRSDLGSYLNIANPSETTLGSLFPGLTGLGADQLSKCYNATLGTGNAVFDIFQNNIFDVITQYYKENPQNFNLGHLPEKAANLFKSMQEIATHTLDCAAAPKGFQLGLTQLSDMGIGEFSKLMGAKKIDSSALSKYLNRPKNLPQEEPYEDDPDADYHDTVNHDAGTLDSDYPDEKPRSNLIGGFGGRFNRRRRTATIAADPKCFPKDKSPLPVKYDLKGQGLVTDVRFQGKCGSCWIFASIASLESAYRIKGKSSDLNLDLSEQQLLTCAKDSGNGCDGGTSIDAFNFILSNFGVTDEKTIGYDYEKSDKTCETKKKKRHAKIKDYCLRGTYVTVNDKPEILTDADIQSVIREFGCVYTTIYGEDTNLKHYKSGVYNHPTCSKETNHAVTIVGWDEAAWIVKNSWGTKWGEDGFFKIKRGENMCGINTYITFPIV